MLDQFSVKPDGSPCRDACLLFCASVARLALNCRHGFGYLCYRYSWQLRRFRLFCGKARRHMHGFCSCLSLSGQSGAFFNWCHYPNGFGAILVTVRSFKKELQLSDFKLISSCRSHLRQKLEADGESRLLITVRGHGYSIGPVEGEA